MKKIVLTSVCTLALAGAAFAQGTVNFATFIPVYITGQTNSTQYSPLFGGGAAVGGAVGGTTTASGAFYYELLWTASGASKPTSLAGLASWTDSGYYAVNAPGTAGYLQAGNGTAGTAISGLAPASTGSFMLAGWSANLGTTWSQALATLNSPSALQAVVGNAFFGLTSVGQVTPAGTGSPGVNLFGTVASGLINSPNTQLYLVPVTPVPEPATLALAALGGASLLLFRRRK